MGSPASSNDKPATSLNNGAVSKLKPGESVTVKPPPAPAATPKGDAGGGKVVSYDAKTDKFNIVMTKDGSPGLLPTYQQQMEEAKETCKGDADPSVIASCKQSQQDKLIKGAVKSVTGYEIGGPGFGPAGSYEGGKKTPDGMGGATDGPPSVTGGFGISF